MLELSKVGCEDLWRFDEFFEEESRTLGFILGRYDCSNSDSAVFLKFVQCININLINIIINTN